jgi:hypothetical protein
LLALVLLTACAPHTRHRSNYQRCVSAQPDTDCPASALQEYRPATPSEPGYLLGFIEFDDQGQLFYRAQMTAVVNAVLEEAAPGVFRQGGWSGSTWDGGEARSRSPW